MRLFRYWVEELLLRFRQRWPWSWWREWLLLIAAIPFMVVLFPIVFVGAIIGILIEGPNRRSR